MPFVPLQQQPTSEPSPAAPPGPDAAPVGHFQPNLDHVISEQTRKSEQAKAEGSHTLRAFGLRDPRTPRSVDLPQAGGLIKAGARGMTSTLASMTGETPEQISAREKRLGLDEPQPTGGERAAEVVGGLLAPSPGKFPGQGATFEAARAVDKATAKTLGQQTGYRAIQLLENAVARLPGGGAIVRAIKRQNEILGHTTDDVVGQLASGADAHPEGVGTKIEEQLKVAAQRMKNEAGANYDEVEKFVPKALPIGVNNTMETLRELTTPLEGAENVSERLIVPEIRAMREGMEKDISNSPLRAIPYGTLKQLRTRIGNMVDWGPFSTDVKNGQLKRIYNALTADMNIGASEVSKEAKEAVDKANKAYAVSKEKQALLQSVINHNGGKEKVFSALMRGTQDTKYGAQGITVLREVLAQLDEPGRQLLAAGALRQMGRAVASEQNVASDVFSANTFLTNWGRMDPQARELMFGKLPGNYSQSITRLAANMEALKAYGKLLPNPSNTAQALIFTGEVGYALHALISGDVKAAAALAGTTGGTMALAHALTNPATARWLADRSSQILMNMAKASSASSSDRARMQ